MTQQALCASACIVHDSKMLIVKRSEHETSFPGIFEIPGGHIELGEGFEEGLRREVKEETGLDVVIGDPYFAFTYTGPTSGRHIGEIHFMAELTDASQPVLLDPNEHSEFQWITEDQINTYEFTDQIRQSVVKGFARKNTDEARNAKS